MGRTNAVDPAVRAAIERELLQPATPRRSRAAIAREHGVSVRTVSRYADELGIENPFATRDVRQATEAATDRQALRRAEVSDLYLTRARQLLEDMDKPHVVFSFGGKDNVYAEHTLERAPTGDLRNLMQASALAFDKHLAADKHDADNGDDAAREALGRMFAGLDEVYARVQAERAAAAQHPYPDESEPPT